MLKKAAVFVIVLALLLLPVLLVWLLATPAPVTTATAAPTAAPALPGPGQAFRAAAVTSEAEAVATPTPALVTVTTWALTVRACPGVSCEALGWLHRGEVVVLDGPPASAEDGGTWVPVRTAGLSGWVNLRFLSGGQR